MCQEIGHVFGLGHTSEDDSSQKTRMDYSTDPQSISPNQHDYDMLSSIYSHLDSYDSCDNGGSSGGGTCNARPGKSCNKFSTPADPPMGILLQEGARPRDLGRPAFRRRALDPPRDPGA